MHHGQKMQGNGSHKTQEAQSTRYLLMVRPYTFRANEQTAETNAFQAAEPSVNENITALAQAEFDSFAALLRKEGLSLCVIQDDAHPDTPDALFPNNWASYHSDGRIAMYPMFAPNRRLERREEIFEILADDFGFEVSEVEDLTHFEDEGIYLEGTGSMVLDHIHGVAYASLSPRTDPLVLETYCEQFGFEPLTFHAWQQTPSGKAAIYHTNVMLSLGTGFAILCINAVSDIRERQTLLDSLRQSGRKIIEISEEQMGRFAGNALEVVNDKGEKLCVMSTTGFESLRKDQVEAIQKHARIIHSPLSVIEKYGGGSARCMIAEVFLPRTRS